MARTHRRLRKRRRYTERRSAHRSGAGRHPRNRTPEEQYSYRRLKWLRRRFSQYNASEGWQKTAWREAYDRSHYPYPIPVLLSLCAGLILLPAVESWVPAAMYGLAMYLAICAWERRRVARTAAEYLAVFAEAREQTRYIPVGVRKAVMARDRFACRFCKATEDLHIDHIYPHAKGGSNEPGNLQTLCSRCNMSKGPRSNAAARRRLRRRWWR